MTDVPREVTDRQRAENMRTPQIVARLNEIEERPGRVRTEAPARVHEEWRALIDELRTRQEEAARRDTDEVKRVLSIIEEALRASRQVGAAESQRVRSLITRLDDHLFPEPEKPHA